MVAHAPEDASIGVPSASSVPAHRLEGTGKPTVWSEFGQLAAETGAVNLGQGFPDWQPPKFVVDQMRAAMDHGHHQYTRPAGHPQLVEVLAKRYSKHFQRPIDAMTEVCTTVGASQALYLTLQAGCLPCSHRMHALATEALRKPLTSFDMRRHLSTQVMKSFSSSQRSISTTGRFDLLVGRWCLCL